MAQAVARQARKGRLWRQDTHELAWARPRYALCTTYGYRLRYDPIQGLG